VTAQPLLQGPGSLAVDEPYLRVFRESRIIQELLHLVDGFAHGETAEVDLGRNRQCLRDLECPYLVADLAVGRGLQLRKLTGIHIHLKPAGGDAHLASPPIRVDDHRALAAKRLELDGVSDLEWLRPSLRPRFVCEAGLSGRPELFRDISFKAL